MDVPVYPRALLDAGLTGMARQSSAAHPEVVVYITPDAFDKVDEFYKKKGGSDVPKSRKITSNAKVVILQFPGRTFAVQLSWVAANKKAGTVIQYFQKQ
jgi:hypothetical protein